MAKKLRLTVAPKKPATKPTTELLSKESEKIKRGSKLYKPKVRLTAHIRHGK